MAGATSGCRLMLDLETRLRIARGARDRWMREGTLRLGFGYVALGGDPERGHLRLAEALEILARAHELAALVARLEREAAQAGPGPPSGTVVTRPDGP